MADPAEDRPLRPVNEPPSDGGCQRRPRRWWRSSGFTSIRDVLLFTTGIAIIGYQVLVADTVDTTVLLVGAAFTGLPLVFGGPDAGRKDRHHD